jgi:hypothetical protein
MTVWHYILIGGTGVFVLAILLVHHFTAEKAPDTTTHAPEAEANTRFITKVRRGTYHTHIF